MSRMAAAPPLICAWSASRKRRPGFPASSAGTGTRWEWHSDGSSHHGATPMWLAMGADGMADDVEEDGDVCGTAGPARAGAAPVPGGAVGVAWWSGLREWGE